MQFGREERNVLAIVVLSAAALYLFEPTSGLFASLLDKQIYGWITPKNILAFLLGMLVFWRVRGL